MTTKAELRAEVLAARRERAAAERHRARAAVTAAVLDGLQPAWRCVAAYRPMRTEPGSDALLDALHARGLRVLLPVVLPDRDLAWSVAEAPLGVEAVAEADLVLVPALAVSVDGARLGRGGGSYDRALRRLRPGVPRVALLFDGELRAALPVDPWDVPVDAVVSPSGWQPVGPGWTGNDPIPHHGWHS